MSVVSIWPVARLTRGSGSASVPFRGFWQPNCSKRTSPMLETAFEAVDGRGRVRVARAGKGPPVVLLHGYPENLQIWANLVPLLATRFEVFAFDWPGMGYSDPWPG